MTDCPVLKTDKDAIIADLARAWYFAKQVAVANLNELNEWNSYDDAAYEALLKLNNALVKEKLTYPEVTTEQSKD